MFPWEFSSDPLAEKKEHFRRGLQRDADDMGFFLEARQVDALVDIFFHGQDEGESFDQGAYGRWLKRKETVSLPSLAFWWLVHNNIAHNLIGVLPIKPFFKFHDWTGQKIGSNRRN